MSLPEIISPQAGLLLCEMEQKNAKAHEVIRHYAKKHALMDITIGAISLIPGAAIPALVTAFATQTEVIYKPMARELAQIYIANTNAFTDRVAASGALITVAAEFAQEFAFEFLVEVLQELFMEIGFGALATMIPFAGAVVAGTLDYVIATMMTWRVGIMTAVYFQNGGSWIQDRKNTFEIAKDLTGGIHVGVTDLLSGSAKNKPVRVNMNDIPRRVPQVLRSAVSNLAPVIKGMAKNMPRAAVRDSLIAMGIPALMVDPALQAFYASAIS